MILLFGSTELIAWGGIFIIALLIFAETGFLLGLIIPGGETLVFTAGILVSTGTLQIHVFVLLVILIVAGFAGDFSGYFIGKKYGHRLYAKEDSWYFKKRYLLLAESFFKNNTRSALIVGKFMPVIRPFSPLMAGVSGMKQTYFIALSFTAVVIYMSFFLLLGYFLGNRFPNIKNYLGWILPISILVLLIPVFIQIRKNNKDKKAV